MAQLAGPAREFIAAYGERGYLVLRAVLDAAAAAPRARLGDFEFKMVRRRLRELGLEYNPALLLSKLEKEYGLIETTYKSSSQHWWRILDRRGIEEAVAEYEGRTPTPPDDPRLRLLRVQFYSLQPERLLEELRRLPPRPRPGSREAHALRRIAFQDLPLLVEFLERARAEYPDELAAEIALAERLLEEAEARVASPLRGARGSLGLYEEATASRGGQAAHDGLEGG